MNLFILSRLKALKLKIFFNRGEDTFILVQKSLICRKFSKMFENGRGSILLFLHPTSSVRHCSKLFGNVRKGSEMFGNVGKCSTLFEVVRQFILYLPHSCFISQILFENVRNCSKQFKNTVLTSSFIARFPTLVLEEGNNETFLVS